MTEKIDTAMDRSLGCLLAGATGDALGAAVEFIDRNEIIRRFGVGGIRDYAPAYGVTGLVTDDTQMTLFTAEGCLRSLHHSLIDGPADSRSIMRNAYLRWLKTQGMGVPDDEQATGWLLEQRPLFARRAPGNTCLSALSREGGERNNSKGCGGVMRVAPCGIVHAGRPEDAFRLGCDAARLTHGHPTGYLASGFFSAVIAALIAGQPLAKAIASARPILAQENDHEETLQAVDQAGRLAGGTVSPEEAIPLLGEGWIAEEALSIALYCALKAPSLEEGIIMAVNITGDSDSTGSIAGNLLGAIHGAGSIPQRWLRPLELREVIEIMASDLVYLSAPNLLAKDDDRLLRYPPF